MKLSARVAAIEFAFDEVRIAVVKTGGKTPRVLELHRVGAKYASPEERYPALVEAAREACAAVKSRPGSWVLAASSENTVVRRLKIPFKGKRKIAAAIQFELEPHLAVPIDELVVDHVPVREIDGGTETLAIGIRREVVAEQLGILLEAGIRVDGVGLDGPGLVALWKSVRGAPAGIHALLHVRESGSLMVVTADRSLAYFRYASLPRARFQENPNAVARDLQNMLRAFVAGWESETDVASLLVCGPELYHEEESLVRADVTTPVEFGSLVAELKGFREAQAAGGNAASDDGDAVWAPVIGVAAAAAGGTQTAEFLKGDLASFRDRGRLVRHAVFSAALALIGLGGYLAYCFIDYGKNMRELEKIGKLVWEEYAATFPNAESADARPPNDLGGFVSFDLFQNEVEKESQIRQTLSIDMFNKPSLLDILAELALKMPDNKVGINELEMVTSGNTSSIKISGEVRDSVVFGDVYADLERSTVFDVESHTRQLTAGKETFLIVGSR